MSNRFSGLILRLEKVGLEQISEMMIASSRNDKKQVLVEGVHFLDNIHYSQKDIFYIKGKTKQEEFYVRSDGEGDTNLLLYSHTKAIIKDGLAGVFSIGSAISSKREEIILCICQVIDLSRLEQIEDVLHSQDVSFRKFENKHFNIKSMMIFANL